MRDMKYVIPLLFACSEKAPDPEADPDEDSYTNQEEWDAGSDPENPEDIPYRGGWGKDMECRFDMNPTGNNVGDIAEDFALIDQYGDTVHLQDFCARPVLLEFSAFT
jgi:hypothetical protein